MAREAIDLCLLMLKESNNRRFESYRARNSVLIKSHNASRDHCRVHIFSDNLSRNSCVPVLKFELSLLSGFVFVNTSQERGESYLSPSYLSRENVLRSLRIRFVEGVSSLRWKKKSSPKEKLQ